MPTRHTPRLVLASASPRRRALLELVGWVFEVVPAAEAEGPPLDGESPVQYARRSAEAKAVAVSREAPDAVVLGADTVVAIDETSLGKPADAADACRMLAALAGRSHWVHTAVSAARAGEVLGSEVASTQVFFRALSSDEIEAYVATGEPLDKAGAYGIQGRGAALVERIEGCYSNVVGLPLSRTRELLIAVDERINAGNGDGQC